MTQPNNNPQPITDNRRTQEVKSALSKVERGLGYLVMWGSGKFNSLSAADLQQRAVDAKLPQEIVDNISPHTVTASIGLSIVDTRWKRAKFNDERIEAKVLHVDQNGNQTIEFLGYDKDGSDGSAKGKRTHLDKVAIDSQGNWLHAGNADNDFCKTFMAIVDHHLNCLGGNDVYEKVTRPLLTTLRSCRIARNNYYVGQTTNNDDLLEAWDLFFASIGYELVVLTQAIDERTRQGLTSRASQDLQDRLEKVHDKIKTWKDQNRVHGRSQDTVIARLGEIMVDAEGLEKSLGSDLQSLRDAVTTAKKEALGIINSQAPSGIAPAVYAQIKAMLTDDRVMQTTEHGNVYLFQQADFDPFLKGTSLTVQADRVTASLGYYSYVAKGLVILRPRAELSI